MWSIGWYQFLINKSRRTGGGRVTEILSCDNPILNDFLPFPDELLQGRRDTWHEFVEYPEILHGVTGCTWMGGKHETETCATAEGRHAYCPREIFSSRCRELCW